MSLSLAGLGAAFKAFGTGSQPNLYFPGQTYTQDDVSPRIDIDTANRAFVDQNGR